MTRQTKIKGGGVKAVLAAGTTGAAAALIVGWLDPFGRHVPADAQGIAEPPSEAILMELAPLVVSLTAGEEARARTRRLRVAVVLTVDDGAAGEVSPDDPRLRDGFIAAARRLGPETLAGPDGIDALRDAFLAHARAVLGDGAVTGVLVTDYVLA